MRNKLLNLSVLIEPERHLEFSIELRDQRSRKIKNEIATKWGSVVLKLQRHIVDEFFFFEFHPLLSSAAISRIKYWKIGFVAVNCTANGSDVNAVCLGQLEIWARISSFVFCAQLAERIENYLLFSVNTFNAIVAS